MLHASQLSKKNFQRKSACGVQINTIY